jgi:hypothetical protein
LDFAAGQLTAEPVADSLYRVFDPIMVSADVLSGNVGAVFLITVWFSVQDQAELVFVPPIPESLRPQEDPQLERHVEPGEAVHFVEAGPGEVVNPESRLGDES